MSTNKKFTDAMRTVAEWVAAHDFAPETIEGTVQIVLDHLKKQNREITISNMNAALAEVKTMIRAQMQDKVPEFESEDIPDTELDSYVATIDKMSSTEMREHMKDPEVAAAIERVLAAKAKQKPKQTKPQPKPAAPKPQPKDPLVAAIDRMSADELKRQLAKSPQIAAGIENTLQAAARRQQ